MDTGQTQLDLQFRPRVFTLAKDAERPGENQDAWALAADGLAAALADGVTSSLFARQWARLLTEAVVAAPDVLEDREELLAWLARQRAQWSGRIDVSQLAWFQKPKLREGAFATLLSARLVRDAAAPGLWRLRATAVGDTCLFLVRDGKTVCRFPLSTSAEFDANPLVIGSVDLNRDAMLNFKRLDQPCLEGDLVVLCTDAVAAWAVRLEEAGEGPAWEDYWNCPPSRWQAQIAALRDARQMRVDDATLMLLRVRDRRAAEEPPVEEPPAEAAAPAEDDARAALDRMAEAGLDLSDGRTAALAAPAAGPLSPPGPTVAFVPRPSAEDAAAGGLPAPSAPSRYALPPADAPPPLPETLPGAVLPPKPVGRIDVAPASQAGESHAAGAADNLDWLKEEQRARGARPEPEAEPEPEGEDDDPPPKQPWLERFKAKLKEAKDSVAGYRKKQRFDQFGEKYRDENDQGTRGE